MDVITLIISLISGAVGGNLAGSAMPDKNLGALGNTIAGLLGGGLGEFILKALGVIATAAATSQTGSVADLDLTSILASVGVGGASGGALTAIIALIKDTMQKK